MTGREPSDQEVAQAAAVGWFETRYGRAAGQFARFAEQGLFNWGAVERGMSGGTCPDGYEPGTDVGGVCFRVWPTDDQAADDYIATLVKNGVPLDQGAYAQAAAMRRAGYYQGFHYAPGYNEALASDPRGIYHDDPAEADQANIAAYAGALQGVLNAYAQGADGDTGPPPVRSGDARSAPFRPAIHLNFPWPTKPASWRSYAFFVLGAASVYAGIRAFQGKAVVPRAAAPVAGRASRWLSSSWRETVASMRRLGVG